MIQNIFFEIFNSFVALNLIFDLKELLGELFVFFLGILMPSLIFQAKAQELGCRIHNLVPEQFSHTEHEGDHGQLEGGVNSSQSWYQVPRVFELDECEPVCRIIVHQFQVFVEVSHFCAVIRITISLDLEFPTIISTCHQRLTLNLELQVVGRRIDRCHL